MKRVLKIIPAWRSSNEPKKKTPFREIKPEERDNNSWWYLDGDLEEFVGYDKAIVSNCKSGGFAKETIKWFEILGDKVTSADISKPFYNMCLDGEVDVEVEGISRPCKGFFWTVNHRDVYHQDKKYEIWDQRGLVCFADDKEACDRARTRMNNKERHI